MLKSFALSAQHVLLLPSEFNLLEVFQSRCQLSQVRPQLAILLGKLIYLLSEKVHLINSCPVSVRNIKEDLYAVILFIEEGNLVLQLLHCFLIGLMLILLRQLVHVLSTLVQFAQARDFIVSDLDLIVESTCFLFLL